jgi:hypothetical protein
MGYFIKKGISGSEGLIIPSGTTAQRPATPINGAFRYNTDTVGMEYYDSSQSKWIGVTKDGLGSATRDGFTGDGSTAQFTMSQSYTAGDAAKILVFVNGVYQTASNYSIVGTTITFTAPIPTGLGVHVLHGVTNTHVSAANAY